MSFINLVKHFITPSMLTTRSTSVETATSSSVTSLNPDSQQGIEGNSSLFNSSTLYGVAKKESIPNKKQEKLNKNLIDAVFKRSTKDFETALKAGADINARHEVGYSALHFCARYGIQDIFELALKAGAEINAQDANDSSVLHLCVSKGNKDIVEIALNAGADIEARDNMGNNVLHTCASIGNIQVFQLLLSAPVFQLLANIENKEGNTPFTVANIQGNVNIALGLLEHMTEKSFNSINKDGYTALYYAVDKGLFTVVERLIKQVSYSIIKAELGLERFSKTVLEQAQFKAKNSTENLPKQIVDLIKHTLEIIEKAGEIIPQFLQQEINPYFKDITPLTNMVVDYIKDSTIDDLTYNQALSIIEQDKIKTETPSISISSSSLINNEDDLKQIV